MRIGKSALFALVVVTLGAASAEAQDSRATEVVPYMALGSAGTSPLGVALIVPVTSTLSVETDVAYRRGEGRINALSTNAGLVWDLPQIGRATPFLAAGVGLAQYGAPVLSTGDGPIGTDSRLAFTVNAGGGMKMRINEQLALRTDARWFNSVGSERSEQFRVAQGLSFNLGAR